MKHTPEHDVMEQRIRQMAESLEPPSALSPERIRELLPDRQPAGRLTIIRRYTPSLAAAACLLVVLAGTAALRGFTGEPVIQAESSRGSVSEPSAPPESSAAEESSSAAASEPDSSGDASADLPENGLSDPPADAAEPPAPQNSPAPSSDASSEQASPETPAEPPAPAPAEEQQEEASGDSSSPEGPPNATPIEHLALQDNETLESYRDVYTAMEDIKRTASQNQLSSSPVVLASAKADVTSAVIDNVDTGGAVVTNNKAICAISGDAEEPSVLIYQLNGKNTRFAAELNPSFFLPDIQGMHVNYLSISQLLLDDDILIIAGKAYYWADRTSDQQNVTVFSFYDISDPAHPAYLSTLCQDGQLTAAYLEDGTLSFVTQYAVPSGRDLTEENLNSYLPYAYENGRAIIPRRSQIQISEDAAAPVYTSFSTVDLSDVSAFADTYCYLGGTDSILINDQLVCMVEVCADPDRLILTSFEVSGAGIGQYGSAVLEGSPIGEVHLLPNGRGVAATMQNSDGSPSLYLLNKKMELQGALEDFAPASSIFRVVYDESLAYFLNDADVVVAAADCSSVRNPNLLRQQPKSLPSAAQSVSFGSYSIRLDYCYDETGVVSGLTIGMYASASDGSPSLLHSTEISGELYIPAMYDSGSLYADERSGLIGFAVTRYTEGEDGYLPSYSYMLYQYSETDGFTLLTEQPLEAEDSMPEFQVGFLSRQTFYVVLPDKVLALDPQDGSLLAEVPAAK